MKHIATVALMLNLGVAGVYAQEKPVKMKFSGTNMPSTINLQPNTHTGNTQLAGKGTLGAFTFHELQDHGPSPEPPSGCSGPSFAVGAGAGVFRFQDESLLIVTVMDGSGCINPSAMYATQTVTLSDHKWNRAFHGRVRRPDDDGNHRARVARRLWRAGIWNDNARI